MSRRRTVDQMMRQSALNDTQRSRIHAAARAFSTGRLQRMRRLGIRFWQDTGVPPIYDGWVEPPRMSTRGAYLPEIRTIRLRANAGTSDIRHEIVHAWDHVRGGRVSGNPDRMTRAQRERIVKATPRMWSERSTRHRIGRQRLTVAEMLELYRRRVRIREHAFDNPNTREGYSRRNVREFYAEGYSVLFGTSRDSQVKLWLRAEELFTLLQQEARAQGLSVPSAQTLQRAFDRRRRGR